MNVTDFIYEDEYKVLKAKYDSKTPFNYTREKKIAKNYYALDFSAYEGFDGRYLMSVGIRYNYFSEGHMNGGGIMSSRADIIESWESLKRYLNKWLERFPDYSASEQLTLF